jgi:hypothetical protein
MSKITSVKINCPDCECPIQASIVKDQYKFLLYVCPDCKKNIIYYKNKVEIISDEILKKLVAKNKLSCCGKLSSTAPAEEPDTRKGLTKDFLVDLKILLETSNDVDDFISKI